jgi:hypothetical protein
VTERLTVCAAPEITAVDTAKDTTRPCCTNARPGFTEIEKSDGGTAVTVSETLVACEPVVAEPVTAMLEVAAAALAEAVTVIVELCPEDTEAGMNDTVTPAGRPDADRETDSALPATTEVETMTVPLDPACTVSADGDAEIEKSDGGTAITVSATVVACEPVVAEPVTVMVEIDATALAAAFTVIVEFWPEATDAGLNETVTPEGRPDAERDTVSALPEVMAVAMVETAEPPAAREMLDGLAEIEKSVGGTAVTVSETAVVCVPVVAEPVTVMLEIEATALAAAVTVIVEFCPEETDAGLNETVTPEGRPDAAREMDSALPVTTAVEMATVPLDPACTVSAAGDAETEKSLGGGLPTMQSLAEFENSFWTV